MMREALSSYLCAYFGFAQHKLAPLRAIFLAVLFVVLSVPTLQAQEPATPPDAATGITIYENRCANCHGPQGGGDGELAPNLQNAPTAFADPAWRETAVPADLFDTITNGRLTSFMPPFGPDTSDPISEANRWDLVATLYSLSTPPEAIERGAVFYQENCLACHGASGSDEATADLTSLNYWFNRSNATVQEAAMNAAAHDFTLEPTAWQEAIDYSRTFSYQFADLFAPAAPIDAATISGQIFNGATNETVTELEVSLRAFTRDLDEALTLTEMVDENGRFTFDLTLIPPDWVYIVSTDYNETRFSSEVDQLNPNQPTLEMPIIVYDATTDETAVGIDQIHIIAEFIGDKLRINELYIFNNRAAAVFTGKTGNVADGTVEITLPAGAENIAFQRAFQSLDSFIPASEMIQTETGWADTLPLRPGRGSLSLLAQYELPYEADLTLAHPLRYDTNQATLSLPDVGAVVANEGWAEQAPQVLDSGTFLNYVHPGLTAGNALTLELNGRPGLVLDAEGNNTLVRDTNQELLVGGIGLLLVVGTAVFLLRQWQQPTILDTRDDLLQAIATLDDAYDAGSVPDGRYQRQRAELKGRLVAIWKREVNRES
ncbi:MAG: cytochrome c [Chloroflexota bacterium]